MSKTYTLYIAAYSPETIPLARLAQYMQNLAILLGHEAGVHFDALKPGSTQLVTRIDWEDVPKVEREIENLRKGEGRPAAVKAREEIDRLLADDNAGGFIYEGEDKSAKILAFPGVEQPKPVSYGPFNQEGSIDGILISLGGADTTVHIQLQNGEVKFTGIETNRETARRLAPHLYEPVRLFGTGRWIRGIDGEWELKKFRISEFQVLAADDLSAAVGRLREIEGSGISELIDPIAALRVLRDKSDGLH